MSCLPYGIAEALDEVIIAQEGYVAATGVLSFNERKLPKAATDNQFDIPPTTLISARLKGKSLRKDGFTQRFNKAITLEVKCYASWCAHPKSGEQALVFLQQTKSGYLLTTNPCGGHIFTNPTRAALDSVVQCYTKGICPKSEYR